VGNWAIVGSILCPSSCQSTIRSASVILLCFQRGVLSLSSSRVSCGISLGRDQPAGCLRSVRGGRCPSLQSRCYGALERSSRRTDQLRGWDLRRLLRKGCGCSLCCIAASEYQAHPTLILIKAAPPATQFELKAEGLTHCCERSRDNFARVAYSWGLCKIISSGNYMLITSIPLQFQLDVVWFCTSCPRLSSVCYTVEKFSFQSNDALNNFCEKLDKTLLKPKHPPRRHQWAEAFTYFIAVTVLKIADHLLDVLALMYYFVCGWHHSWTHLLQRELVIFFQPFSSFFYVFFMLCCFF